MLMIQGPLGLNWHNRKWGFFPRIENGELGNDSRITPDRVRLWINTAVHVNGFGNHVFIKLHAHGAIDTSIRYFFGEEGLADMWNFLESNYNDGKQYMLHYVSAWELYTTIRALCKGPTVIRNNERTTS